MNTTHPFFVVISEYFWLLCLSMGVFNYAVARRAMHANAGGTTEEAEHYLRRLAIGINVPWLVMGAGQIVGATPTVWCYFRPQDGNPFVLAWFASIVLAACTYAWWVLFAGGAEKVRDMNLLSLLGRRRMSRPRSLQFIKLSALAGVVMLPFWVWIAVSMNVPLPK